MQPEIESGRQTVVVHLMASPFFGGPERQVIRLCRHLGEPYRSIIVSFSESGKCQALLDAAIENGTEAIQLQHNAPRYRDSVAEIERFLRDVEADVLCCHGYKPDILGHLAARRAGVPSVCVSRGWTAASWKVRVNEFCDRWAMRRMERVVCVSDGQARRVRKAGVRSDRISVIRNAIPSRSLGKPCQSARAELEGLFPGKVRQIVGAAGRLSPEKGFDVLVRAFAQIAGRDPAVGCVVFGEGPERPRLERMLTEMGIAGQFRLFGFCENLDPIIPTLDLMVLPSHTEGLPNVALEAAASGVAIVATRVGGTPEVVRDGVNGWLVPPGDPTALSGAIQRALRNDEARARFGQAGRELIRSEFSCESQAQSYSELFRTLANERHGKRLVPTS